MYRSFVILYNFSVFPTLWMEFTTNSMENSKATIHLVNDVLPPINASLTVINLVDDVLPPINASVINLVDDILPPINASVINLVDDVLPPINAPVINLIDDVLPPINASLNQLECSPDYEFNDDNGTSYRELIDDDGHVYAYEGSFRGNLFYTPLFFFSILILEPNINYINSLPILIAEMTAEKSRNIKIRIRFDTFMEHDDFMETLYDHFDFLNGAEFEFVQFDNNGISIIRTGTEYEFICV